MVFPAALIATLAMVPSALGQTRSLESAGPAGLEAVDSQAVEDAFVALVIRSQLSPYEHVRYEVKVRGTTLIASLSKRLAHGYGDLEDVGLLPIDELPGFIDALSACDLSRLGEARRPASDDLMSYALEVRFDDFELDESWAADSSHPGSPQWCVSQLITATYSSVGDPVPFQNLFWDEGEYGELNTSSNPPAILYVDDRNTGLMTPVHGLRLDPGVHVLRYVNDSVGIDRSYDVTIVVDHTTRLEVELR